MRLHLFRSRARRLYARRDNVVRRLDAVQESVIAALDTLNDTAWGLEYSAAEMSPGALARHIVQEFGWLGDVLERLATGEPTSPMDDAVRPIVAPGHLGLAVRNILDRRGRPGPDAAPMIDVAEAVVTHLEGHTRSLASLTPLPGA
jgi:hypothetical protein